MFMDFGLLPPEINATRIYTGPGAAPLLAASTAWQGLAGDLSAASAAYQGEISGLAAGWHGVGGQRMAAAAAPHIRWLNQMAVQAEQVGLQAAAQAASYEAAFVATTPPPVIAANRSLNMSLIATNILGQNTPAIMATEALYLEMWAQCAAAMYAYAAATGQSSALPQFSPDQQNTNPAGQASQALSTGKAGADTATRTVLSSMGGSTGGQSGAVGAAQGTLPILGSLPESWSEYLPGLSDLGGAPYDSLAVGYHIMSIVSSIAPALMTSAAATSGATGGLLDGTGVVVPGLLGGWSNAGAWGAARSAAPIAAKLAGAPRLGGLSVPGSWAAAAKGLTSGGSLSSAATGVGGPHGAVSTIAGLPLAGMRGAGQGAAGGDGVVRVGPRPFVMSRPLSAG